MNRILLRFRVEVSFLIMISFCYADSIFWGGRAGLHFRVYVSFWQMRCALSETGTKKGG